MDGNLIEVNKGRQLLHIVRNGQTLWTINTSTGNNKDYTEFSEKTQREISGSAVTPEGFFKVNRERTDGWWEGELGDLYRPKYFRGGVAVHGSNRIPNYPASHGCVRVSLPAMDFIWSENIMPMRSMVWVHGG
jgi:lipoprotein-anchoring transpeptidase ErfK/SrfK